MPSSSSAATRAVVLVAALLAGGLPVLLAPSPAAAAFARLQEPRLTPVAGVPFTVRGVITSDVRRPVLLQRVFSTGETTTIARTKATREGTFAFRGVRIPETSVLRALAPRFRGRLNHPKVEVVTAPLEIHAVQQTGSLVAVPPIVQPGAVPEAPSEAAHVVADFQPVRPGRLVQLEELVEDQWVAVGQLPQDARGSAAFSVPPGHTYRAVTVAGRRVPALATDPVLSRPWSTSFQDTFDGRRLNQRVWRDRPAEGASSQGGRTCARVDGSVRSVTDGTLLLGVGLDPQRAEETCTYETPRHGVLTTPYLLNSQIDTRDSYHFTHGWAAARIKWQQPDGMHGGFWLLPSNGKVPGRPDLGTEIDVAEYFGQDTLKGGFSAHIHHLDENAVNVPLASDFLSTADLKPPGDEWWSSYHVFSVEWTPQHYVFRVDGREFWREDRAVSQAGEYLVLSMLTSDFELPDLTPADLSATASVDWVRVWRG